LPKIRIISDIAPTKSHTAGIVLEQIISLLPSEYDVDCEILIDDGLMDYNISNYLNPSSCRWYRKPQEIWPRSSILLPFKIMGEMFSNFEAKEIVKSIIRSESRSSSDLIIVVIQGQTSIRIANLLAKNNFEISTVHWDPWSWWHREKGVPNSFYKEINLLNKLIQSSGSHLVPSHNFREDLQLTTQRGIVLYPHVGSLVDKAISTGPIIQIVFIGQTYSKLELKEFLTYLEDMEWLIGEKEVQLHVYGNSFFPESKNIIQHGWLSYEELAQEIQKYDAAFLPYPRSREFEDVAKQSFPSKLATYVTANLPIIYLGPSYSSFAPFIEEIGISLGKIKAGIWGSAILELIVDREGHQLKNREIYEGYFSKNAQRKSVGDWLKFAESFPKDLSPKKTPYLHTTKVRELSRPIKAKLRSIEIGRILFFIQKTKTFPRRKISNIKFRLTKLFQFFLKLLNLFLSAGGPGRLHRLTLIFLLNPRTTVSLIRNRKVGF